MNRHRKMAVFTLVSAGLLRLTVMTLMVLTSTNVALPYSRWTVLTNTYFDNNGNLTDPTTFNPGFTFYVNINLPTRFYQLQTTGF